jgi:hypothetical protein
MIKIEGTPARCVPATLELPRVPVLDQLAKALKKEVTNH